MGMVSVLESPHRGVPSLTLGFLCCRSCFLIVENVLQLIGNVSGTCARHLVVTVRHVLSVPNTGFSHLSDLCVCDSLPLSSFHFMVYYVILDSLGQIVGSDRSQIRGRNRAQVGILQSGQFRQGSHRTVHD